MFQGHVGVRVTTLRCKGRAVGSTGAATSAHVRRLWAAGSEGLRHHVGLRAAGVRSQMAGGQVGAAVAAAHGGPVGGRTGRRTALARCQPAAHHAVRAEVARHVCTARGWQLC